MGVDWVMTRSTPKALPALPAVCLAAAIAACMPVRPPAGPPPAMLAEDEPVAFLLERRDSLRFSEDVSLQLVRLNSRLFRRNQPLRFTVDTILDRAGHRARPGMRPAAEDQLPADVRERVAPLLDSIRVNAAAVRDTAWAMLTEEQRAKADAMLERARQRAGERGGRENTGASNGRPARPLDAIGP